MSWMYLTWQSIGDVAGSREGPLIGETTSGLNRLAGRK